MKYSKYIINGDFAINDIVSDNKYLKPVTIIIGIVTALSGMVVLSAVLPLAVIADGGRYSKLRYYRYVRLKHKQQYINSVFLSLSVSQQDKIKYSLVFNNLSKKLVA